MARWIARCAVAAACVATPGVAAGAAVAATFRTTADAYVTASSPKANFGSATELQAGAVPVTRSYLRFAVQGLSGPATKAVLWLWVTKSATTGYDVRPITNKTTWSESSITDKNAPAVGAIVGSSGPVTFSTWVPVDVTSLVPGNGTVNVALTSTSASTLTFASREAGTATAPYLEVTQPDLTPPSVTLAQPRAGATLGTATPTYSGTAGTAPGDLDPVTVKVYAGASAGGSAVQTLTAQRAGDGTWSAPATAALADGTYTAQAQQADASGNVGRSGAATFSIDTTAPAPTLTQPADGATTGATPTFAGRAGTAPGDASSVTVDVLAGGPSGAVAGTLTAAVRSDGSWSVTPASALADGTYGARVRQSDALGHEGTSAAVTFTVDSTTAAKDPVLIGAGDISSCESGDGDAATAALVAAEPDDLVYTLGDNAYSNGTADEYANCYDPTWGAFKARTRPVLGNHDFGDGTNAGAGYFGYFANQLAPFGAAASDPTRGWYSYDVGSWHVAVLNAWCYSQANCDEREMERWFSDDLAAHPSACSLVMMHNPRFSSGDVHGSDARMQTVWSIAYRAGVDVVLAGHEHEYERFAPQDDTGAADPTYGTREFVVGTGGYFRYGLGTRQPNSEVFNTDTYGVLRLALHPGSYDWRFIPEAGKSFTDSGTNACHGAPPGPPPPPPGSPAVLGSATAAANGPALQLTIARPAAAATGSLLLAVIANQGGSSKPMTPPAGWTTVTGSAVYEGTNARLQAFYRFATAAEPASYTFTQAGTTGYDMAGGIMAIGSANPTAPVAAAAGQSNGSTNAQLVTAPSVSPPMAGALLLFAGACNVPESFLPPQSMNEIWDLTTSGTYKISTETAWQYLAAAGATGTRAALAETACRSVGDAIAIAPSG